MSELRNVRVQVIDPKTGNVLESVNTKTSAGAVLLSNGTTLENWLQNSEAEHSEFQLELAKHLAQAHIDPAQLGNILLGTPTYDDTTGTITFTKYDGSKVEFETALSKVVTNWVVVNGDGSEGGGEVGKIYLKLQYEDDESSELVDLSKLIDVYYGYDPGESGVKTEVFADTADGNKMKIKVTIQPKTITEEMLVQDLADKINAVASADKLGQVKIGDGISVDEDGVISASAVTRGDETKEVISLNFVPEVNNVAIAVADPDATLVTTTVGTGVSAISVTATKSGAKADDATLAYQWYKKTLGTDVAFVAIEGATAATLAADKIDVTNAGSTMYYCVVSVTGEGVVADAVQSRKVTVTVNPAA